MNPKPEHSRHETSQENVPITNQSLDWLTSKIRAALLSAGLCLPGMVNCTPSTPPPPPPVYESTLALLDDLTGEIEPEWYNVLTDEITATQMSQARQLMAELAHLISTGRLSDEFHPFIFNSTGANIDVDDRNIVAKPVRKLFERMAYDPTILEGRAIGVDDTTVIALDLLIDCLYLTFYPHVIQGGLVDNNGNPWSFSTIGDGNLSNTCLHHIREEEGSGENEGSGATTPEGSGAHEGSGTGVAQ